MESVIATVAAVGDKGKAAAKVKRKLRCRECEFDLLGGEEKCPSCGAEIVDEW